MVCSRTDGYCVSQDQLGCAIVMRIPAPLCIGRLLLLASVVGLLEDTAQGLIIR